MRIRLLCNFFGFGFQVSGFRPKFGVSEKSRAGLCARLVQTIA